MGKSYDEILKELEEKVKNKTYVSIDERNKPNIPISKESINPYKAAVNSLLSKPNASQRKSAYQTQEKLLFSKSKDLKNIYNKNNIVTNDRFIPKADRASFFKNNTNIDYNNFTLPNPKLSNAVELDKKETENRNRFNEINKKTEMQQKIKDVNDQYNIAANSYYDYLQQKVAEDDIGIVDKTIGVPIRGVIDSLSLGKYHLKNENGDSYIIPTYSQLKQQKVMDSYNTNVGKVLGGAGYELGKVGTSAALNALVPGSGTVAYFGKSYLDQLNNSIAEGHNPEDSMAYATLGTLSQIATGKLLGGTANAVFGTGSSELSKSISKGLSKAITDHPRIVNALSSAVSEGSEEFIQEYLDKFNRNLTLGEQNKIFSSDTFEDAVYSAAVGALTGSVSGGMDRNNYAKIEQQTNVDNFADQYRPMQNTNNINQNEILENYEQKKERGTGFSTAAGSYGNTLSQNSNNINQDLTKKQIVPTETLANLELANATRFVEQPVSTNNDTTTDTSNQVLPSLNNMSNNQNNIIGYTSHEINNYKNGKVKIATNENDIIKFINASTKIPSNAKLYFGKIGNNIANKIKSALGISVENYNISLQTDAVRHIFKNHGDNAKENLRGQEAITSEDFKLIPKIVSDYDIIRKGETFENNNPTIVFQKQIGDKYYLVSYISDKKHNLEVKTMWKFKANEKNPATASDTLLSQSHTSKTDSGTSSFSNGNITQSNDNVKLPSLNNMSNNQNNIQNKEDIKIPIVKKVKSPMVKEDKTLTSSNKDTNHNIPLIRKENSIKVKAKKIAEELNGKKRNINIPKDKKLRSWSETATESEVLKDFVAIEDFDIDKVTYTPISNKKTLENAQRKVSTMSYEEGLNYINAKMSDSKVDLTDLAVIDQLLVQAKQKGDSKTAADLFIDKTILGTELGQMVQQFSMIGRTTPEGQLRMYQKIVKRAKATGDKSFDGVEITPEMIEGVLKTYKSDGTFIQEDLDANMEKFKQQIVDQMKSTTADKINGWRYLSMLGNPKTHIRNIVSNIAMNNTMKVKNAMARTLESILIRNKDDRTKTWKKASKDVKEFAKESAIELKDVIQGESKYGTTTQLKMEKKVFNNKLLDKASKLNSKALSAEDWLFSKSNYIKSLQEYLTAKGITTKEQINSNKELVEQAKLYAIEQAEIATFRQYSKIASHISKIENTNAASKIAVGAMLPFKKTPINVAKTGVKYSPLGLIKTATYDVAQLKNGNINASQLIDNLSQGLTGTSLMLIGYALAKGGFVTGESDDDKEGKYDSQLGNQGYALKIGNSTYSLSWLSPVAMPFLMGASAYNEFENKEEWDANIVIDTLAKTIDPVSEMSFISGLTDALSSYKQGSMQMVSNVVQNTTSNYALQFIPTLLSQIAATGDDKVRSTAVNRDSSFKFGDKLVKQAMYKIPGLRNKLPVATDIWGNEKTQSNDLIERAYRNFLSPYTKKEVTSTTLDKELKRVYSETGETSVIPGIPQGYLKYKDTQYNMNSEEYASYKKIYGTTANKYLSSLINNKTYKNASDDEKSKMIETIYKYSKALANENFFSSRKIDYTSNDLKNINKLKELNMNNSQISEFVAINSQCSSIRNDKDIESQEKHKNIAKELLNTNLTDKQLAYLYSKYYSTEEKLNTLVTMNIPIKEFIKLNSQEFTSDYYTKSGKSVSGSKKKKVIEYINSLNLSIPQKAILIKSQYNSYDSYNKQIVEYTNKINATAIEKKMLLKNIGFDNYDKEIINYVNSQKLSIKEKEKKLKELGFTIRNGRVYK